MSNNKNVLFLREEYGDGQGTFTYPNGEKYEGDWKNGKYNGQGTYTWSDGEKYEWEFKDGNPNGQGTMTLTDGTKGIGEFREGQPWNMSHYDENGNIAIKFVNGKME